MSTSPQTIDLSQRENHPYALRREGGFWRLTFDGRQSMFRHELGALYVAYLLGEPPREPLHGVAVALKARERFARVDGGHLSQVGTRSTASLTCWKDGDAVERVPTIPDEALQERAMGLEEAVSVRALWRRQRELEGVLADRLAIAAVKAEAQQELEEITEHLRQSPWLSRRGAERCARAVNCKLGLLGQEPVDVPPTSPQFTSVAPQDLVITNTGGAVALKLTCPTSPGTNTVLRASPPQNSAVRACRNYRILGTCPAPAQGAADITSLYVAQFGVVPVGKRIFVRASTMVDGFESLPREFQTRVPASA